MNKPEKELDERDWFAGNALIGILAYPGDTQVGSAHNNSKPSAVADAAYAYADAMMKRRKQK